MSMKTFHVSIGLAACLSTLSVAAPAADDAPPLLEKTATADARGLVWTDGSELPLEGQDFHEGIQPYSRLPDEAMDKPDLSNVRYSMHCPAGLCIRFRTDSNVLSIRWTLDRDPPYGFWNDYPASSTAEYRLNPFGNADYGNSNKEVHYE